uniref:OCIA domain-containing protein 1 n=1 Tax=Oncorhynchus mykiss TaxID=8022 RepID=A0A8K9VG05_ONCMY
MLQHKDAKGQGYVPNTIRMYGFFFPITAVAVSVAQVLVMKGEVLAPSLRFGYLPKVAISGLFGYIGGKNSYTKLSQEKSLKQGQRHIPQQFAPQNQSGLGDANKAFFSSSPQLKHLFPKRDGDSLLTVICYYLGLFTYVDNNEDRICCVVILFLPQQCKNNQYGDAWVE